MLKPEEYFEPLNDSEKNDEYIPMESKSFAKDVWERFRHSKRAMVGLILLTIIVLFAVIGPFISPYPYDGMNTSIANNGPSLSHWFGTDQMGRDEFTRVLYGTRISLMIGFVATFVNVLIGVIYGGVAGYVGGKVDMILMRIMDVIYSIPAMIYIILIMLILGSNVYSVMIGICVNGWVNMARLVRGQIISLKEREFAIAAYVLGASRKRILFKHLLVNTLGPVIVTATLMVPQAIFNEAFLSFIGIGISAPQASLGTLAQDAKMRLAMYPMQMVYPVAVICLVIFSLNFIGEGLEDALNPKGRK
ncbi:MAG: ABC transporter permease [Lachnospiraceae bacterium]|nr:ABC transporter permease [Lachnospiraceae bacterium]